ncbi:hypothetical protein IMZ08_18000 [Bacillus luteolus]|uniref:Uncharacterized protein n=1 Tax=Litchfieldia luteola TaxID=682179 RepID=A0ABR9QN60_9BACI|nr:hypothetical protein [Cytobacillus luteolus]MBE4909932.1 hypothetical protein [Cytobacillus luteolus]MBP1942512.1 hypothetical protein [Cytobacillus luteolus]
MKRLIDFNQFKWIQEETERIDFNNWSGCYVSNLIPNRYEHYCKIIHPIYRDMNIQDENLLWSQCDPNDPVQFQYGERLLLKDLAKRYKLQYTKEISSSTIYHALGGYPRYLILSDEGSIDKGTLEELISVLSRFIKGEQCYFHYDLLKTVNEFQDICTNGHLYYGNLEDVNELFDMGDLVGLGSPTYWWTEDRGWCIHTDFDCRFSLIGGSRELIEALLANNQLECIKIDSKTRIDDAADKLNNPDWD